MAEASGPELRKAGGWVIVWGVSLIVAGIVAIVEPAVAAVATALLLAWLFVFSGIAFPIRTRCITAVELKRRISSVAAQHLRSVNQSYVRKCLGEITQLPFPNRIVLFR